MKSLFRSVPEDLMTPAFREQCQEIAGCINAFLVTTGQNPDRYADLASFMKKPGLCEAYIEQALDLGWPTFDMNGFIDDQHMAALEGFLLDGGRQSDLKRIVGGSDFKLNITSPIEELAAGGVRGLFKTMGLVHSPRAVEITRGFAKRVYNWWPKEDLRSHVERNMSGPININLVAISADLGVKPYKAWFDASMVRGLQALDQPMFQGEESPPPALEDLDDLSTGSSEPASPQENLETSLREAIRVGVVFDTDRGDMGAVAKMNALAMTMVAIMEIPAYRAMLDDREASSIWKDLQSRMKHMLKYAVDHQSSAFLSIIITHSVIVEAQRFWSLAFPDQDFLERRRLEAQKLFKTLTQGEKAASMTILSLVESWRDTPVSKFERSNSGLATLMKVLKTPDNDPVKEVLVAKHWPDGISPYLWPVLIEHYPLIDRKSPVALTGALVAASTWGQQVQIPTKATGNLRKLYGFDFVTLQRCVTFAKILVENEAVKHQAVIHLHKNGFLNEKSVNALNLGGDGLANLGIKLSETVQAALLENDLGL